MRLFAGLGLITLGLLSLPVACSSGDGGGISGQEFAARYCALFQPCCDQAGIPGDQTGCKQLFGFVGASNSSVAADCIGEYEELAKAPDWCDTFSTLPEPESCKSAFAQGGGGNGTKPPGAECSSDDECSAGANGEASCSYDFDTEKEYCERRNFVAVGEPCVGTRDAGLTVFDADTSGQYELSICNREDGLYCDSGVCAQLIALGGECTDYLSCEGDDTYCQTTCKQKVAPGGSCVDGPSACDEGGYCDTYGTQTCLERKPNGTACDSNEECQSRYCDVDVCDDNPGLGGLSLLLLCQ